MTYSQAMSSKKTNRDHGKKKHHPLIESEAMASHLKALLSPAIFNQQALYRQLGMRNRILNLPYSACGSTNSFMAQCSGRPRINSSFA